ncbi:MAG: adenylate/guanylate cyclase domain-containing protein [Mesorhizobium sp.]|nr:MAG: adenylate/guanylate cyclase domain-containing protein [Mesorhizobium sp.]
MDDDDIFGDGVNVAARLEGIAGPNGIWVSGAVRDHIGNKLGVTFVDAGEQHLKNIDRSVRVYRVVSGEPLRIPGGKDGREGGGAASIDRPKPSIAVLPFSNMSGDPEQEYFADGITEDIITDLSKLSGFSVIARTSTFTFQGRAVDVGEVRTKFNVSNVLEGSVRKSGGRVRINAQLVDAADGTHLWAERYDRDLSDIFLVQDEIAHSIVDALKVRLLPVESEAIRKTTTSSSEAYQFYLRGRHYLSLQSLKAYDYSDRMFMKAIEIDPGYARAYAGAADCHAFRSMNNADVSVEHILALCDKALELDPELPEAHASRGFALSLAGRYDESSAEFERAIELDPSSFEAHYFYARSYVLQGRAEEAADYFRRVTEIAPDDFQAYGNLSQQYWSLGRIDDATEAERLCLERAERELERHPDNLRAVC